MIENKNICIILFLILFIHSQVKSNPVEIEKDLLRKGECDADCESSMAKNSISFKNFVFNPKEIRMNIIIQEKGKIKILDEIYFKFNKKMNISNDTLAVVLSICAKLKYQYIYFDLIISNDIFEKINKYTFGDLRVKGVRNDHISTLKEKKEKIIINFSGGFDSLSLLSLLPKNSYDLVSVYWKGYEREENFFKKFKPYTLETNFRGFLDEGKIWEFMGIGCLLYNEMINAKYQIWGTAFEEWDFHGAYKISGQKSFKSRPFDINGIFDIKLTQGLTEVGTALIILKDYPYFVYDSLISLADENNFKSFRKKMIIKILKKKYNLSNIYLGFDDITYPKKKIKWGFFVDDFLILWWIKNIGLEETSKFYSDIPDDIISIVESNSLKFYEKYNTNFLNNIPHKFKKDILGNLARLNIEPYDEKDFKELMNVLIYMKKYHSRLEKHWNQYFN